MAEKKKPKPRKSAKRSKPSTRKSSVAKPRPEKKKLRGAQRKTISRREAEETLRKDAEKVTPADVERVVENSAELQKRFESGGPLGQFLNEFKLLMSVVKDYWAGRYRKLPYWTVAAIVAALLYVLNPFDLIPDFIPVVGQLDDALVLTACLALIRRDIHRYRQWKAEQSEAETEDLPGAEKH